MTAPSSFVTIVSGLPRSGTSMMMRMLDVGGMPVLVDNIRVADDDNPRGYYEYEPVKQTRRDSSWVQNAGGKAVKLVYRLLYDLPRDYQYRVLFMRRNLNEVLASQRKMLARDGRGDEVEDAEMAALFRAELAKFDAWIKQQSNFSLIDVQYNDLLDEPGPVISRVAEFLSGSVDPQRMATVVDKSLYRNRT